MLLLLVLAIPPPTQPPVRVVAVDGGSALTVTCTNCSGGGGGGAGGLTNTELRAGPVPMYLQDAGVLNVNPVAISSLPTLNIGDAGVLNVNFPASQAVTGTFWQATQNINIVDAGPPLNVNFPATQAVSAASLPLPSGAATGTLQGTGNTSLASIDGKLPALSGGKIPVDIGASIVSVTGGLTDTQLRAAAVPVSLASAPTTAVTGTFWPATQPISGTVTTLQGAGSDGGLWQTSVSNMPLLFIQDAGTLNVNFPATQAVSIAGSNPCNYAGATLAAVAGATSGTSAVQLIGLSGSTKIYLCSVNVTGVSGTTPTFSLKYGTGSACATGGVTILGAWTTAANTVYTFNQPFVTPAGQALCYLDTGTSPVQNYAITYVQQ